MSLIRTIWKAREGTGLNKFTKSEETTTSVKLVNAPDSVTVEGTPFSVANMNNIEDRLDESFGYTPHALGVTARSWAGICYDTFRGYWFACVSGGGIYKSTDGKTFTAIGGSLRLWSCIGADDAGNIYAGTAGGDIYKSTDGAVFTELGLTGRYWSGLCYDTKRAYWFAAVANGDIYKSTDGATFAALGGTSRDWAGITADGAGSIYACVNNGGIYKSTDGATFAVLGGTSREWRGISAVNNSVIVACVHAGDIYISANGGTFEAIGLFAYYWACINAKPDGTTYAGISNGDIYTFAPAAISPSSILPVENFNADFTMTEDRYGTIRLSGALTGNRTLTLPASLYKKTIINDCTGAYYVRVIASGQTTGGAYLAAGDAGEIYCDGSSAKLIGIKTPRIITMTRSGDLSVTANTDTLVTFAAATGDTLGEFGSNAFTAKHAGTYDVAFVVDIAGTGISGNCTAHILINGVVARYTSEYIASAGAVTAVYFHASHDVKLNAGDVVTLEVKISVGTSIVVRSWSKVLITQIN